MVGPIGLTGWMAWGHPWPVVSSLPGRMAGERSAVVAAVEAAPQAIDGIGQPGLPLHLGKAGVVIVVGFGTEAPRPETLLGLFSAHQFRSAEVYGRRPLYLGVGAPSSAGTLASGAVTATGAGASIRPAMNRAAPCLHMLAVLPLSR